MTSRLQAFRDFVDREDVDVAERMRQYDNIAPVYDQVLNKFLHL